MDYITAPLGKHHNHTHFFCGSEALDRYLKVQARQDAKNRVAAPFVHVDPVSGRVIGFYTLSAIAVELASLPPEMKRRLPRHPLLPATLIGRLGVDQFAQGRGPGALLLADALRRSLDVEDVIGAPGRLFLPMRTIERVFVKNASAD
jgi:GNAT superfamily N-acetyltransferase